MFTTTIPAPMPALAPVPVASDVHVALAQASPRVRRIGVTTTAAGATSLQLDWGAPFGQGQVARYIVTALSGANIDVPQTVIRAGATRGVTLSGLDPFTMYSVFVRAVTAAGERIGIGHIAMMTHPMPTQHRYLYTVSLPYDREGFRMLRPEVEVYDVNHGHRWVKSIPLPAGIYNARGIAASATTGRLYISFFDTPADQYQTGGLLCLDLYTEQVIWVRRYSPKLVPAPDRFALTPDGSKIYLPAGEGTGAARWWVVLDAISGEPIKHIYHVSNPHNTVISADGRYAFLEGQEMGPEPDADRHTVAVVDTTTDTIVRRVGPFRDVVRPYTVNGSATLMFATLNNFVGFQVADITTGKVIYTVPVPGVTQPTTFTHDTDSHGIALTADERTLLVVDRVRGGIDAFDVSNLSAGPPRWLKFIRTRTEGRDLAGEPTAAAANDTPKTPGWIASSYDGRYVYAEGGEIIDTTLLKIVGQLSDGDGMYAHSKFVVEIDWDHRRVVRAGEQFGVGRVP